MGVLSNIEPKEVFENFEALSMVPRRTFRDEKISDFLAGFAKEHGLKFVQDKVGNVIIYKDGTKGYENSEPVILQGHMDMVASRTIDSDHDFDSDPLDLFVDGDLIGARGTTLGADDGFALAFAMAVLTSKTIKHPPIEAVFTVDEETGMAGAEALDVSLLKGRKFFNMDGEEEGVLTVGCAGARICDIVIPVKRRERKGVIVTVKVRDYLGGHSGNTIQDDHGNAHKDIARILFSLKKDFDYSIISIDGGSAANVIAQNSTAILLVAKNKAAALADRVAELGSIISDEYGDAEPSMKISAVVGEEDIHEVFDADSARKVIWFLRGVHDGVQLMDRVMDGAVESSLNIGAVKTTDDAVITSHQIRSSKDSKLEEMMDRMEMWCEITGAHIDMQGSYPAWPYKEQSELRPLMVDIYKKMFGKEPKTEVVHGGLEGGILMGKNPDFDIVCFGPDLIGVHTPDERIRISSTQRTWEYFKAVLEACK